MRKTEEQKLVIMTETKFPTESYPVMYKAYWSEYLSDEYKLENNRDTLYPTFLIDVYRDYYNLQFNTDTINQITYNNERTPYQLVIIVRIKSMDKELYLWEFFDNWMKIKELNTIKWI